MGAHRHWRRIGAATGTLVLLLTGCGDDSSPVAEPTTTPSVTPSPMERPVTTPTSTAAPTPSSTADPLTRESVSVYFLLGEKVQPVHRSVSTPAVAGNALRALFAGPTDAERAAGLSSSVPDGTTLLGLTIRDGLATVDLSGAYESGGGSLSMTTRLAQVVFTLTGFPSVDSVQFRVDGRTVSTFGGEGIVLDGPATRERFEESSPAVLIETPALGDTVGTDLRVTGSANVFEAVFFLEVRDADGSVLATRRVQASAGTGTRGTFDVRIPLTGSGDGPATLTAYVYAPKDGARQDIVRVPIRVES